MNETEAQTPIFLYLWHRRWTVGAVTAAVVAVGVAYTLLVTPVWEAKATLVFPTRTPSILGAGGFSEQAGLAASLMGGPTPLKIYKGMLESERTVAIVAGETGLKKRQIKDMRDLTDQAMESSITISARNRDPELAKKVVSAHLAALDKINAELSTPLLFNDSAVLEKQLEEQQAKLRTAEAKLLAFQNQAVTAPGVTPTGTGKDTTVVAMPGRWAEMLQQLDIQYKRVDSSVRAAQSKVRAAAKRDVPSNIPPVRKWRDRLTELEYDLQVKSLTFAPEAPEMVKLKETIRVARQEMQKEVGKYVQAIDAETIDPTMIGDDLPGLIIERVGLEAQILAVRRLAALAPGESIELSRRMREVATLGAIVQQLQAQYQLALVQAERDPNRWEILDAPEVDEKPVNKSLSKNGILSLIVGLLLGCVIAGVTGSKTKASPKKPEAAEDQPTELKKAS